MPSDRVEMLSADVLESVTAEQWRVGYMMCDM